MKLNKKKLTNFNFGYKQSNINQAINQILNEPLQTLNLIAFNRKFGCENSLWSSTWKEIWEAQLSCVT